MYCLKCKRNTEDVDVHERLTRNNRRLLVAKCSVCQKSKSRFIKGPGVKGSGVFNDLLSKIGEIHLPASRGEYVPGGSFNNQNKYSYCGPGTKYEERNKEGYRGINELDKMCKLHDEFYTKNPDTANRNISDVALAHRAEEIANDSKYDSTQRKMAYIVHHLMKNKARFGLSID